MRHDPHADLPPLPEDVVIPDYVGVIVGWRMWRVADIDDSEPTLCGLFRDVAWPPGAALVADCDVHGKAAPHWDCRCGIHALKRWPSTEFRAVLFNRPREAYLVFGQASLWGTVIEGSLGWRAAKAYPADLAVFPLEPSGDARGAEMLGERLAFRYRVASRAARLWELM